MKNRSIIIQTDFIIGTVMAVVMATVFSIIGGLPLMITFVPGVVLAWGAFFYMYKTKVELPSINSFLPLFFIVLAWQFIHFNEEFITGFYDKFPILYGSEPYSQEKFVTVNMVSYFVFTISAVLLFRTKRKFFLIPVLFYIMYGAIGNAIAHTWWSIKLMDYFPGLITAQLYWFLGPWILFKLTQNKKANLILILVFAIILVPLITVFIK